MALLLPKPGPLADTAPNELLRRIEQLEANTARFGDRSASAPAPNSPTKLTGTEEAQLSDDQLAALDQFKQAMDEAAAYENMSEQEREKMMLDANQQAKEQQLRNNKKQRLINAGFSKIEATTVVQAESDLALKKLQQTYDKRRESFQSQLEEDPNAKPYVNELRDRLGDEVYERYLQAEGWPTAVDVGSLMNNSPGELAGLRPGDRIIAYDNKRIFSGNDLNALTALGQVGETMLMEVERGGERIQLTIPRGPIGVSSRRGQYGR